MIESTFVLQTTATTTGARRKWLCETGTLYTLTKELILSVTSPPENPTVIEMESMELEWNEERVTFKTKIVLEHSETEGQYDFQIEYDTAKFKDVMVEVVSQPDPCSCGSGWSAATPPS